MQNLNILPTPQESFIQTCRKLVTLLTLTLITTYHSFQYSFWLNHQQLLPCIWSLLINWHHLRDVDLRKCPVNRNLLQRLRVKHVNDFSFLASFCALRSARYLTATQKSRHTHLTFHTNCVVTNVTNYFTFTEHFRLTWLLITLTYLSVYNKQTTR